MKIFKILLFEIKSLNHSLTILEIKTFLSQIFRKLNSFFYNCKSILILKILNEKKNLEMFEGEEAEADLDVDTNSEENSK